SGSGGDDEALAGRRLGDRLSLVAIERERLAVDAEYVSRLFVEGAVAHQLIDRCAGLETRIDADKRLRPELIACVDGVDLLVDIRRADLRERAGELLVIAHQGLIEFENVHANPPPDLCIAERRPFAPISRSPLP